MAKKRINIRIDSDVHKIGQAIALQDDTDFSALVEDLIIGLAAKRGPLTFGLDPALSSHAERLIDAAEKRKKSGRGAAER